MYWNGDTDSAVCKRRWTSLVGAPVLSERNSAAMRSATPSSLSDLGRGARWSCERLNRILASSKPIIGLTAIGLAQEQVALDYFSRAEETSCDEEARNCSAADRALGTGAAPMRRPAPPCPHRHVKLVRVLDSQMAPRQGSVQMSPPMPCGSDSYASRFPTGRTPPSSIEGDESDPSVPGT